MDLIPLQEGSELQMDPDDHSCVNATKVPGDKETDTGDKAAQEPTDKNPDYDYATQQNLTDRKAEGHVNAGIKKEPTNEKSDYDYATTPQEPTNKKPDYDYATTPQEPTNKKSDYDYATTPQEWGNTQETIGYITPIPEPTDKKPDIATQQVSKETPGSLYSKITEDEKPPEESKQENIYMDINEIGLVQRVRTWPQENRRKVVLIACVILVAVVIASLTAIVVALLEIEKCGKNTCQNGSTCSDTATGVECSCLSQYTGSRCETEIEKCGNNTCQNGGTCSDTATGVECSCLSQYTGGRCETEIIPCSSNLCLHDGTCTNTTSGFSCTCQPAYTGSRCQTEICALKPCKNNGRCIMTSEMEYICVCQTCGCVFSPQLTPTCDIDMSTICQSTTNYKMAYPYDCHKYVLCTQDREFVKVEATTPSNWVYNPYTGQSVPSMECAKIIVPEVCGGSTCSNKGKCADTQTGFKCTCPFGFTGRKCEIETDKCHKDTCENGGTCTNTTTGVQCTCPPGYLGDRCNIESCSAERCENAGTCSNTTYGFRCDCPAGFYGQRCEIEIFPCATDTCLRGGTCSNTTLGIRCRCPPDTTGDRCETNIACGSDPCMYGTCNILELGFNCTCQLCSCSATERPNLRTCFFNRRDAQRACKAAKAQHPEESQWHMAHPYRCDRYIWCLHNAADGVDNNCLSDEHFNTTYQDNIRHTDVCVSKENSPCVQL